MLLILSGTFRGCSNLTTIPELDIGNAINTKQMFYMCENLTTIPVLNTTRVKNAEMMFSGCPNLTEIPVLDMSQLEFNEGMFSSCPNLSDNSLNNILAICTNATKIISGRNKLKYIGLTSEQANRCKTLSNYSAFIAAGWTTGY